MRTYLVVDEEHTTTSEQLLKGAPDEVIRRPLWEFRPQDVKAVQHERRVRFGFDDEPAGDPEYS
jgi:hypothetical protein